MTDLDTEPIGPNTPPELIDNIRRREIAEQLEVRVAGVIVPPNEAFASYVQSAAFSVSMSRTLIRAMVAVEKAIDNGYRLFEWPISPGHLQGLTRRGFLRAIGEPLGENRLWSDCYEIPRAGELILELLYEAGFIQHRALRKPLPPPPPGWADPRPVVNLLTDGPIRQPSRRERIYGAPPT